MKTGELAERAGVNLQTVRYYERMKLLRKPARTEAGYRLYYEQDLHQLIFIKECQRLGFTLQEIQSLAQLHRDVTDAGGAHTGSDSMIRISDIARERIRLIDEKICALAQMRERLRPLLNESFTCPAQKVLPKT